MLRHTLIEHDGESIEGGFPVLNRHIQMRKWRETHLQMRTPGGNGFRVIGLLLGFVAIFHSTYYLCIELLLINHRGRARALFLGLLNPPPFYRRTADQHIKCYATDRLCFA